MILYSLDFSSKNVVKSSKEVFCSMEKNKATRFKIPTLTEFDFQIKYSETDRNSHIREIGLHTHKEFELYLNLSGDVSFLVENKLYELSRGDVIIARPGEHHHCVYRSDAIHKHFWILFDCEKNKGILDFLQNEYKENYFSPHDDLREELLDLFHTLHNDLLTDENKIYNFFRIFAILKNSGSKKQSKLPHELSKIISYIHSHIYEEISVKSIADSLYISQSTLERKFKEVLNMTPLEYIKKEKLVLAAKKLQEGESVLNAGASVGYNDTSYFIELFKRYYKITPYQYKKTYKK